MIWSVNECVGVLTCLLPYSADIFEMAELVTRVVDIPSSRALGKDARTGAHARADPRHAGCNPRHSGAATPYT